MHNCLHCIRIISAFDPMDSDYLVIYLIKLRTRQSPSSSTDMRSFVKVMVINPFCVRMPIEDDVPSCIATANEVEVFARQHSFIRLVGIFSSRKEPSE
jgi:hypothetical protein